MKQDYEYYAFISYSWNDKKWAKWLQRKLESYRLPSIVKKQYPDIPKKLKIFRDRTDIRTSTSLQQILHEELDKSKYLIVVCSPHSAQSDWVGKEIEEFIKMGKKERIILFIIDGTPYSNHPKTECYHPIIKKHFPEILGANIHEEGNENVLVKREKAFIRVLAGMLNLSFDSLWNRYRRNFIQKVILYSILALSFIFALVWIWFANQPFEVQVKAYETTTINSNLPPLKDAIITIQLDNEIKKGVLNNSNGVVCFKNIPAKYMNKPVKINFTSFGFKNVDTSIVLKKKSYLPIERDSTVFGNIIACLYNIDRECAIPNMEIEISGKKIKTDKNGYLHTFIPLEKQRTHYRLKASIVLLDTCIYMPCYSNVIIRTQEKIKIK